MGLSLARSSYFFRRAGWQTPSKLGKASNGPGVERPEAWPGSELLFEALPPRSAQASGRELCLAEKA